MTTKKKDIVVNTSAIRVIDATYGGWMGGYPWTLCVGAGISFGIVPTWEELTHKVYQRCINDISLDEFRKMRTALGWSLDCVLQMCRNHVQLNDTLKVDFHEVLEQVIYSDILLKAESAGLKQDLIKAFNTPYTMRHERIFALCEFFEKYYAETTTYRLINFVLDTYERGKAPRAIISFNADTIFDSFLYLFYCRRDMEKRGELFSARRHYTRILRTVEYCKSDLIPIYHLHGCIFPNEGIANRDKRSSTLSKLVFNEESYMQVAGSVYNWAQATFLYHAQFDRMLFVGLSMSDLNIRKWLYWTASHHNAELRETRKKDIIDLCHMWINCSTDEDDKSYEESLVHLNVRYAYLHSWNELELGLRNIFGMLTKSDKRRIKNLLTPKATKLPHINHLIITCTNNSHTGKTTALWNVYCLLKEKYPIIDYYGPANDENLSDVRAVFNVEDKHVCIETMGDNPAADKHWESIEKFANDSQCAIIITASRMRSETRNNVERFISKYHYKAIWMSHDYSRIKRLQPELNRRYAERVVKFMEEWLKGSIK